MFFRWREQVVKLIAHELSHQWFGNLVTLRYWDETWLNEGLTSWLSHLLIDHFDAGFESSARAGLDECFNVMEDDSAAAARPLYWPEAETPADFERAFDSFAYQKGK